MCSHFKNVSTFFLLYNAFVRSILEYGSVIWHQDGNETQSSTIEKIQKRFLRYVFYRVHGIYPHYQLYPVRTIDMQKEFDCTSLKERRKQIDLIFLYKLLNNLIDSPTLLSILSFNVPARKTRTSNLFQVPFRRNNVCRNSPMLRLMSAFNNLIRVRDPDPFSMSLARFKSSVT